MSFSYFPLDEKVAHVFRLAFLSLTDLTASKGGNALTGRWPIMRRRAATICAIAHIGGTLIYGRFMYAGAPTGAGKRPDTVTCCAIPLRQGDLNALHDRCRTHPALGPGPGFRLYPGGLHPPAAGHRGGHDPAQADQRA